jgi:four helix bundle protein
MVASTEDRLKEIIGHFPFIVFHFPFDLVPQYYSPVLSTSFTRTTSHMKDEKDEDFDLDPQTLADQLEERLIDFAVRIIKLSNRLPKTPAGKHISGQILRCGTSPAPNYGEARGAESRADFIHKMRIVFKELNETSIWLRIIEKSQMLEAALLADLIRENKELCRILAKSLKTARGVT